MKVMDVNVFPVTVGRAGTYGMPARVDSERHGSDHLQAPKALIPQTRHLYRWPGVSPVISVLIKTTIFSSAFSIAYSFKSTKSQLQHK